MAKELPRYVILDRLLKNNSVHPDRKINEK